MFSDINASLVGLPNDMVSALKGQGSPQAVNVIALRRDTHDSLPAQVGAAIACFISGYKRSFGGKA
ncbi:MAG: hypothetical protein AB7P20_08300 [Rhizobiaceae bacterium]